MTERGFEYVKNRLTPSLYDIELDGAEKSKDNFFRKLKIILDDETKEEWNHESRGDELIIAFVQGVKWWECYKTKGTMWQSDQTLAEEEAERKLTNKTLGKIDSRLSV